MARPLYCDESVWLPVADGLDQRGWTVYTARGQDRLGDPDRTQLSVAVDNDWRLCTFDDDFLSLVEGDGLSHAGIVYVDQRGKQIGDVVKAVDALLDGLDPDDRTIHYL
jgi:hypothetical protein